MLCSNSPWPLEDDAQLTEEEIEMLRQPSHGTRTTVLGQPTPADLMAVLVQIQQSLAALGAPLADEGPCGCADCENKTFDATGWGD